MFEYIANWSSIISLILSMITLLLVGSIKTNIINSRRKKRLQQLLKDIGRIPDDAIPFSSATKSKLSSLSRNLPIGFIPFSNKRKVLKEIKKAIKKEDISSIKESIKDFISHTEDL